jgi:putative transposase
VREAGAQPVVRQNPTHPRHAPFNGAAYRRRQRVENLCARLKDWRALATRYDKTAARFASGLYLSAAIDWLPPRTW